MNENNDKIEETIENPDVIKENPNEKVSVWAFASEIVKFTVISLLIVAPIRFFIAQPFLVSGSSMEPTFQDGEYLIVDEASYFFKDPERGQVVVFRYPNDPSKHFIKRVVGLPNETVIVDQGKVTIKNTDYPNGFSLAENYVKNLDFKNWRLETKLGPSEYYVMGDNRPASSDSRDWGPVPRQNLTGSVAIRLFPFTKISVLPGASN